MSPVNKTEGLERYMRLLLRQAHHRPKQPWQDSGMSHGGRMQSRRCCARKSAMPIPPAIPRSLGICLYRGVWPPSKPGRDAPPPERDFCPRMPNPQLPPCIRTWTVKTSPMHHNFHHLDLLDKDTTQCWQWVMHRTVCPPTLLLCDNRQAQIRHTCWQQVI